MSETLGHSAFVSYGTQLPARPDLTEYYREKGTKLTKTLRLILKARQISHAKALAKEALK